MKNNLHTMLNLEDIQAKDVIDKIRGSMAIGYWLANPKTSLIEALKYISKHHEQDVFSYIATIQLECELKKFKPHLCPPETLQ